MKMIRVEDAVGTVLCHDITQIIPGRVKGRAFSKGHVVQSEDIPRLLTLGKEHLYVYEPDAGEVHEDNAALRIARAVAGPGLGLSGVCEGRINFIAEHDGLLKVDVDSLCRVNSVEEVVVATIHTNQTVAQGRAVGGTRVVPLMVRGERLAAVEAICAETGPILRVKPFKPLNVGVVTTGSEVYHGRIKDKFGPVVKRKFAEMGCTVLRQIITSDSVEMTAGAIRELIGEGAGMVAVTGGMSVDPDDCTPSSIRAAGGEVVTYGSPTFPGAMFMLANVGDVPVVGLPGCVMYSKASIFDLIVPRVVAGEKITRADIVKLGHGGYCAGCAECRYPVCGFGKGS